ncbi:MAG: integrase core domain-containing protein [Azoarcus sp.]|jgi:hypothetical protein|nr:integrase core domain-containing protein [Azoarcus sp.]
MALELWLMRQNIKVSHSRPYHPQTQGKLERLHETLKAELLQGRYFKTNEQAQRAFEAWRNDDNLERPHEALGQQQPAGRYRPSAPEAIPQRLHRRNTAQPAKSARSIATGGFLSETGYWRSARHSSGKPWESARNSMTACIPCGNTAPKSGTST